ncbi:MAG: hypothetical protein K6E95_07505 [Lachnospiraceae bacterium]|nr:hypothetical protein [Lachnospiraceae bacterium]
MQIGIDLDNYSDPVVELENLVNAYGENREIGYLKINPLRTPVIVSESKAQADIGKYGDHKAEYPLLGGKFELIVDERAVEKRLHDIAVNGNAYIVRRQGKVFTALDINEILEWLIRISRAEQEAYKCAAGHFDTYEFDYDDKTQCWD